MELSIGQSIEAARGLLQGPRLRGDSAPAAAGRAPLAPLSLSPSLILSASVSVAWAALKKRQTDTRDTLWRRCGSGFVRVSPRGLSSPVANLCHCKRPNGHHLERAPADRWPLLRRYRLYLSDFLFQFPPIQRTQSGGPFAWRTKIDDYDAAEKASDAPPMY